MLVIIGNPALTPLLPLQQYVVLHGKVDAANVLRNFSDFFLVMALSWQRLVAMKN